MAKKQRVRERRPYRTPEPTRGPLASVVPGARSSRRTAPASGRPGGGLPILPLTLAGLAVGVAIIAFVALQNVGPSSSGSVGPLKSPAVDYPAENADMSLGSSNAKVTINEWADFQCPACKAYTETVEPQVVSSYVRAGSVRIVFHDFAFIGADSTLAATAARCAGAQHHFWDFHGYLYANQGAENTGRFNQAFLDQVAGAIGLDRTAFDSCLSGGTTRSQVVASTNQAQSLGIQQTPTFFVGNQQPVVGVPSFAQMSQVIDAAIAAAGG